MLLIYQSCMKYSAMEYVSAAAEHDTSRIVDFQPSRTIQHVADKIP
jgi:hypothetical protein